MIYQLVWMKFTLTLNINTHFDYKNKNYDKK
jgi:hypothetical protein